MLKSKTKVNTGKKSIFRALFVPLFLIMLLLAASFYIAAVYGGVEKSLRQNAVDILQQRLINRKNELETLFNKSWTNLAVCQESLDQLYEQYLQASGDKPFVDNNDTQIQFLSEVSPLLISTLRSNGVNGIFLILNDQADQTEFTDGQPEEKYGLCIRDLDSASNYTGTEDLLVERAPSSVTKTIGCSLDSWWEARYTFSSREDSSFYYNPLDAAWSNPGADSEDLAYFQGVHRISSSDSPVVSYSIPLLASDGSPYAVLGIELTSAYLASLLPANELDSSEKSCYIFALENTETGEYTAQVGSGSTFNRCFEEHTVFSNAQSAGTDSFYLTGRDSTKLYASSSPVDIYNNNNPFERISPVLIACTDEKELFSYLYHIKQTLALVSVFSLMVGLCGLFLVSRHFSRPITSLAKRVQTLPPKESFQLGRLGILEIDQLVDSIEELNRNASRDIARTEFFSRMSHDMRTPMNAIISFSSPELLEGTDDAQKTEYLEKIHSSGQYLLGLINEVLDMTKIESNKVTLQYAPANTGKMWETIIPIIDKLAQKKSIYFQKIIDITDTAVMADEQHLNQIIMNLLSNAVKFTPEKGTVCFRVTQIPDSKQPQLLTCRITVSDNGIGMSEKFMEHLYQPFEQEKEGREGTGLGLSIAKRLTEMMGGAITCVSHPGKGTTFTIILSFRKCTQAELLSLKSNTETAKKEAAEPVSAAPDFTGKRILVCEDHPLNTQIIVRLLERVGIEVTTAENGRIGLDKFSASPEQYFDAVLLDIRMPVMDGLTAARALRSLNRSDVKTLPIIAMTANAFAEDVRASREAGMNEHLSKPVEPQKLYAALQQLLKQDSALRIT